MQPLQTRLRQRRGVHTPWLALERKQHQRAGALLGTARFACCGKQEQSPKTASTCGWRTEAGRIWCMQDCACCGQFCSADRYTGLF